MDINSFLALRRNLPNISFGLDTLMDTVERFAIDPMPSRFPPYNILKNGNDYMIEVAVAGFDERHINVMHDKMKHTLTITGAMEEEDKTAEENYVYRGLSNRNFRLEYFLGDHYEVSEASLVNGKLTLHVVRNIPVEMQPKQIAIGNKPLVLEHLTKTKVKKAA